MDLSKIGTVVALTLFGFASLSVAARGNNGYAKQLSSLVAGQHGDLIAYLRENFGRLRFDPATRKWQL